VYDGWRGGTPTRVGEDNCEAPYQQDEATTLRTARRQGAQRAVTAAEPRRPGRTTRRRRMGRRTARRRRSGRKPPAFQGPTAADRQCGGGRGRRRISGGRRRRRIPWGRVRGAPRTAAVGEDDGSGGGGGHDDDNGGGSGMKKVAKCWRGRVAAFIYRHTFSPGWCNEP
jgi:hypothetical protein